MPHAQARCQPWGVAQPVPACRVSEAPALGCAILAAVAAGLFPDMRAAAKAMVQVERVVQPDPQRQQQYRWG